MKDYRRVIKFSDYSIGIVIPPWMSKELKLKKGSTVSLEGKKDYIILRRESIK